LTSFSENGSPGEFTKIEGIRLLRKIEWCGRISHRSEDQRTNISYDRFIRAVVIGHGDWSITEHASATVDFLVDRGITHEIVRHRIASYTQESTRFVNYEKKMPASFICPTEIISTHEADENSHLNGIWNSLIDQCELAYKRLVQNGCKPQIARSVLPNALASRLIATMNLRTWRHFFIMRTCKEAHPQMREVTIPLLKQFQECIPILYEDIVPEMRQVDAMRLVR
jgi:thymidylate synthase (FAD)